MVDETTILKCRHLRESHGQTGHMVNIINDTLEQRGLLRKGGTWSTWPATISLAGQGN